ncbi:MAG: EAL domain-containing protein [Wenzhouxiangella sp.]
MAIDDFGTGYSSLSYLKRFSINDLKIDQSFVRALDGDNQAIVTAIVGLAQGLGFSTTAEGIETAEQLAFLKGKGCRFGQGYLFSRPLPAEQFAALLRERQGDLGSPSAI